MERFKMDILKLKALEETRSFYKVELKKEDLTERERDKYLKALEIIEGFIKRKKEPGREKNKHLVIYDHRNRIAGR
ncbi:unnamed protein product [marine sediment metagenome]|uniref:Uncharacterized protein n=1 Tax=marine sediment metagenome TaxID=412755 RepID=X1VUS8_9ZZZZ